MKDAREIMGSILFMMKKPSIYSLGDIALCIPAAVEPTGYDCISTVGVSVPARKEKLRDLIKIDPRNRPKASISTPARFFIEIAIIEESVRVEITGDGNRFLYWKWFFRLL